jgi:3-oxoacyl-[acyl-carrier-protein] synthase-3
MSHVTDYQDMMTAPLFGDGSGTIILEATDDERGIIGRSTDHQGWHGDKLKSPLGKIIMQGSEIYTIGVKLMTENALNSLKPAGLEPKDISRLVLHQANLRMMEDVAINLGIYRREDGGMDRSRVPVVIDRYGNTTHATIGLTLDESIEEKPLEEGEVVVLDAVGGGVAGEALALAC